MEVAGRAKLGSELDGRWWCREPVLEPKPLAVAERGGVDSHRDFSVRLSDRNNFLFCSRGATHRAGRFGCFGAAVFSVYRFTARTAAGPAWLGIPGGRRGFGDCLDPAGHSASHA